MIEDAFWTLERDFWHQGVEHYESYLDAACIMVLPAPAGIMTRDSVLASMRGAPRWNSVTISERTLARPTENLALLAYRASASRGAETPYAALCLSTYRRTDARWLMTSHQQTPEGAG